MEFHILLNFSYHYNFVDDTTTALSFQPVEGERAISYKPAAVYKKPVYKLEQDTINRLSYQPHEPLPKEEKPWSIPPPYKTPVYTMENNTIYRARLIFTDFRRFSFHLFIYLMLFSEESTFLKLLFFFF